MKNTEQNLGVQVFHVGRCERCNKETKNNKFCSHVCYSLNKIGEKHDWGYKIGNALRGKPKSPEHIRKAALARKGKKCPSMQGENHFAWKGDRVGFDSLHDWVRKYKGTPKKCEECKTTEKRIYHWTNTSGEYKRDLNDWRRLCVPCHSKFDKGKNSMRKVFDPNNKNIRLVQFK